MKTTLRSLAAALALASTIGATAQNIVTVMGTVMPCNGISYPVHIFSDPGTTPFVDTIINTTANCSYTFNFFPINMSGGISVVTSCDGGITWGVEDSAVYVANNIDTLVMNLSCSVLNLDCNGVLNGPDMPGTPCDDGDPMTFGDTWNSACVCSGNAPPPCNACFTIGSNQPWQLNFTNCSNGGTAPYMYNWLFSDGSVSTQYNPIWNIVVPGTYIACLSVTDANGIMCTTCDSVVVDANGNIGNSAPCAPCVNVVPATGNGLVLPWTVEAINCSTGGTAPVVYNIAWGDGVNGGNQHVYSQPGTYNVCITMTDGSGCIAVACDSVVVAGDGTINPAPPCNAGFWVLQAYVADSLDPNVGAPIPNELWLWNLSSGGTGNYQFVWNWGDNTPNSTDAYPTHFYGNGGPYWLCLTVYDGGCTDTYCDSIYVDENGLYNGMAPDGGGAGGEARSGFTLNVLQYAPTGIAEHQQQEQVTLWPNPAEESLNLSFVASKGGSVPVAIIDLNGREVRTDNIRTTAGNNRAEIGVNDLPAGMYLMRLGSGANTTSLRFVKR
ncbi:MAG TPA: PKD domain-containing protein [Flavobacteriales bacterium]|nr:PKD domain-containing protein [Flavobacteriales bacterium]